MDDDNVWKISHKNVLYVIRLVPDDPVVVLMADPKHNGFTLLVFERQIGLYS